MSLLMIAYSITAVTSGVLHGSVLGHLLFLYMLTTFLIVVRFQPLNYLLTILCCILKLQIQMALSNFRKTEINVSLWGRDWQMKLNPTKSKSMHVSSNASAPNTRVHLLNDNPLIVSALV